MGFKLEMEAAPAPSRSRMHDSAMVKVCTAFADEVKKGNLDVRIPASGDETKGTTPLKGEKQSPREKSARAEAGKLAHYIKSKLDVETRTLWDREKLVCYVAPMLKGEPETGEVETNGNGKAAS